MGSPTGDRKELRIAERLLVKLSERAEGHSERTL